MYPPSSPARPSQGGQQPCGTSRLCSRLGEGQCGRPGAARSVRLRRLTGVELHGSTNRLHSGEARGRPYGHSRYIPFVTRFYCCSRTWFPMQEWSNSLYWVCKNGARGRQSGIRTTGVPGARYRQRRGVLAAGSSGETLPRPASPRPPSSGRRRAEPPVLPALPITRKAAVICKLCMRIFKRTECGP